MWALAEYAKTHADGWPELPRVIVTTYMFPVGTLILSILIYPLLEGVLIYVTGERLQGRPIRIGQAYVRAWKRIGDLAGAWLLYAFLILLMAMSLPCLVFAFLWDPQWLVILAVVSAVGLPFAIYFGVKWFLMMQTTMLEGLGPIKALSRSGHLVTGHWWRVLGLSVVVGLILYLVSLAVSLLLWPWWHSAAQMFVASALQGILLIPFRVIAHTLIYHDLRVRQQQTVAPVGAGIAEKLPEVTPVPRPAHVAQGTAVPTVRGTGKRKMFLIGIAAALVLAAIIVPVLIFVGHESGDIGVSIKRLSTGKVTGLNGGDLEKIAYTDFAFIVDFHGPVEAGDEENTVEAYVNFGESSRYTSTMVQVFAQEGTVTGFQSASSPSLPEWEPANEVATVVEILDAERILISPVSGDFPPGSQIVLHLDFGGGSGYVERVFTL